MGQRLRIHNLTVTRRAVRADDRRRQVAQMTKGEAIDLQASIKKAMEFVAPRNFCKCKVTSVLKYKLKPTDEAPSAYAIELEADYSDQKIEEEVGHLESDSMLREMMSNGPFRIRVVTDGQKIFEAGHFDDYIVELMHRLDLD